MSPTLWRSMNQPVRPDPAWKVTMESAVSEVFSMMVGIELSSFEGEIPAPRGEQTAMVGLAGALCGMVTVRCSSKTASKIATLMLGEDVALNPAMTADAMGEICNMVAGNFKSKIANLADRCLLSVPTVIWGENYVMQTVQPSEGFHSALSYDGDAIWFSLIIHS